jgi:hypothetical protein
MAWRSLLIGGGRDNNQKGASCFFFCALLARVNNARVPCVFCVFVAGLYDFYLLSVLHVIHRKGIFASRAFNCSKSEVSS